eukprot:1371962-Amphidinium_carterae.1
MREPDTYQLVVHTDGQSSEILLRRQPDDFRGWVDTMGPDAYSAAVWQELKRVCIKHGRHLSGRARDVADVVRRNCLPPLRDLSLGKIRHL